MLSLKDESTFAKETFLHLLGRPVPAHDLHRRVTSLIAYVITGVNMTALRHNVSKAAAGK